MPFEALNVNPDAHQTLRNRVRSEGFLIDFLGGLLPGVLFLVGAFVAIMPPVQSPISCLTVKVG